MKIVIFIENNQFGGLDTFAITLLNGWANTDSFVVFCNESHPGVEYLKASISTKVEFVRYKVPLSWKISSNFIFLPKILRRALQPLLRILLLPIQLIKIKNLFLEYPGDRLIVLNGGYPGGETCRLASIAWGKIGRKNSIHNFHNFAISPRVGFGWFENWIDRETIRHTYKFISVSSACANSLKLRKEFKSIENITYIYNGIRLGKLGKEGIPDLRSMLKIAKDPICLVLGNFEPRKGHGFILNAFQKVLSRVPNAHIIAVGGGSDSDRAKVYLVAHRLGIANHCHVFGFIPNGQELISQVDLLVIGSQEFESFGLTAIEAMSRGVPVVSTNIGGLPEVLGDNEGGFLFDPNDLDGFANCISRLLLNSDMRQKVGEFGRNRFLKFFTEIEMINKYQYELYSLDVNIM